MMYRFYKGVCAYAAHEDPLAQAGNWIALAIGTHLPLWPFYILWCAGTQCFPTAWAASALTPLFLIIPWVSRHRGLAARIMVPLAGMANTIFTTWLLGEASGTPLFFVACAAASAMLFRRPERWIMLPLTLLPLVAWYVMMRHFPAPVHRYDPASLKELIILNTISVGVLLALFGWLQGDIYQRSGVKMTQRVSIETD
jgi:hypothetical protein